MIELRWLEIPHEHVEAWAEKKLQYRTAEPPLYGYIHAPWTEWKDVPTAPKELK